MKRTAPKPISEAGAPAALKAIESHEVRCRADMENSYAEWKTAQSKRNEDDEVSERIANKAHRDYIDALEVWHEATKKLGEFDKRIAPERREGEKVGVEEVKEYFRQYQLSIDLALEAYIIHQSQAATLCNSPEEFHTAHAANLRAVKQGAIEAAIREGVLAKWVTE